MSSTDTRHKHGPNGTSRPRALVADGNRLTRWAIVEILEKDFEVETTATATEALHLLQEREHDLLITDDALPDAPGWSLVQRAWRWRPQLPVVVTTTEPGWARRKSHPYDDTVFVVEKPFDIKELQRICRAACSCRSPDSSLRPPTQSAETTADGT